MSTNDNASTSSEKLSNMSTLYQLARRNYEDTLIQLAAHQAALKSAADALEELKRNVIEVILPNAKTITLDIGQLSLWDLCVKETDAALAQIRSVLPKESPGAVKGENNES